MPWRCPKCTGLLDLAELLTYDAAQVDSEQPGLWRYRHTFSLPADVVPVTLGEGDTPLVASEVDGYPVYFKLDYLNPTASHKDRGMTVMMSALRHYGITSAVEDSSGNAGASFSAYAARAGVAARVFVPASAAAGKLAQMRIFGATVEAVAGPRSKASDAVQAAAAKGVCYASHNYNPLNIVGLATAAYEIVAQLGRAPAIVITPAGNGAYMIALHRGFKALQAAGVIEQLPRMIGVQAEACAPLWAAYALGPDAVGFVTEGETLAEGVRIRYPVHGDATLQAASESHGYLVAVSEQQIDAGRNVLARLGFYVEHTSAIVWTALRQVLAENKPAGPLVIMLTGSGLKQCL